MHASSKEYYSTTGMEVPLGKQRGYVPTNGVTSVPVLVVPTSAIVLDLALHFWKENMHPRCHPRMQDSYFVSIATIYLFTDDGSEVASLMSK
jgi:hypothetical protein